MSFYIRDLPRCEKCTKPPTVEVVGLGGNYGKFCRRHGAEKLALLNKTERTQQEAYAADER